MKLTKSIKVGGFEYKIIYPYKFKERTDTLGYISNDRQEILISGYDIDGNKLPKQKIFELFIHEVLHAIDHVYNSGGLGEKDINQMGFGIHQVLIDNFPHDVLVSSSD